MTYAESVMLEKKLEKFIKNKKFIHPKDNRGIYISNTSEELEERKNACKLYFCHANWSKLRFWV